eukprot:5443704-Alexandrium_andersonii.AAC.1
MSASLVGSEMCIRDRVSKLKLLITQAAWWAGLGSEGGRPPRASHFPLPSLCQAGRAQVLGLTATEGALPARRSVAPLRQPLPLALCQA